MSATTINPWSWNEPLGYSQGVVVESPQRTLYAAGQCAIDRDGNPVGIGDLAAQTAVVMDNVEAVLSHAGMSLADVVSYDVHTTDLQRYFEEGHALVSKRFAEAGRVPAGGVACQVSALAVPVCDVEITVIASR